MGNPQWIVHGGKIVLKTAFYRQNMATATLSKGEKRWTSEYLDPHSMWEKRL